MHIRHKGLRRLYEHNDARSLNAVLVTRTRRILYMLRSARQPRDMDQPGFRLHPLRGAYQGSVVDEGEIVRYLANGLRRDFDLPGVPIRILLRAGANPYAEEGQR